MSISRKQIKEWGYKYTNDRDRITFVNESYKLCPLLLDIVKKIPWESYHFEGESTFLFSFSQGDKFSEKDEYTSAFMEKHVTSKCYDIPYYLFGGWWYEYTNRGTLYDFMDKTGDVDVRVFLPELQMDGTEDIHEKYDEYDHAYLNENKELNAYVQHFSSWLFEQISFFIDEIPDEYFIHSQPVTTHSVDGKLIREKRLKHGILKQFITNKQMLKTQFVCNLNGITLEPIEFIILLSQIKKSPKKIDNLNGIFIDNYNAILHGNITGISDRHVLVSKPSSKHKWINHVQRIKYLNSIFNLADYEPYQLNYDIMAILGIIVLFSDHIMKYFALREKSVKETIESMVSNFLMYIKTKPRPHFGVSTSDIKKMPNFDMLKSADNIMNQIDFLLKRNADVVEPVQKIPTMFTRRGGKRKTRKKFRRAVNV